MFFNSGKGSLDQIFTHKKVKTERFNGKVPHTLQVLYGNINANQKPLSLGVCMAYQNIFGIFLAISLPYLFVLIHRVRTVMKNLEKSWNFKTAFSRPGKVLEKWINPESFGKVMEIYFTNLCIIQLCLFGSWISVRDCAWAISHISTLSRSFRI